MKDVSLKASNYTAVPITPRLNTIMAIADFIDTASLLECKHIINELVDRVSTLTGCATELEDASCALTKEIENEIL